MSLLAFNDVHALYGHARILKKVNSPFDVQRFAEAGVGVAQQRQRGSQSDNARLFDKLRQRQHPDIRHRGRRRQGRPREVDRGETKAGGGQEMFPLRSWRSLRFKVLAISQLPPKTKRPRLKESLGR